MTASPDALWRVLQNTPVAHLDVAVIATRLDGAIGFWNQTAEETYGWSADEVIGRNIVEVTSPDFALGQAEKIMASLRAGQAWQGEFPVRRRDGVAFPSFVIDTPLPALGPAGGVIIGASGRVSDAAKVSSRNALMLREIDRYLDELGVSAAAAANVAGSLYASAGAYYRCYLVGPNGRFAGLRECLFESDDAVIAFAAEELRLARKRFNYQAIEVWSGRRLAARLTP